MKIFFVGSPRALQEHKKELHKIYHTIDSLGHENLYHLIIESDPDTFYHKSENQISLHFSHTLKALHAADIILIESSIHSLSMGYLIRMGEEFDKPVVLLHLPNCQPFFFSGNNYERFYVAEYTYSTIKEVLKSVFEHAQSSLDVRFNVLLPPQIHSFLKWITKKKGISKSTFIRQLLQEYMERYPQFLLHMQKIPRKKTAKHLNS